MKGRLLKRTVLGIIVIVILVAVVVSTIVVTRYLFKASPETVHILADGGISPSMANITTSDKVNYVFTGNNYVSIVVERNNITINGNGYTLQGSGAADAIGIYLRGRNNVTIKNTTINAFYHGIWLFSSSNNMLVGNTMARNLHNFGVESFSKAHPR
jgi:parallel beta-helix repeat protein